MLVMYNCRDYSICEELTGLNIVKAIDSSKLYSDFASVSSSDWVLTGHRVSGETISIFNLSKYVEVIEDSLRTFESVTKEDTTLDICIYFKNVFFNILREHIKENINIVDLANVLDDVFDIFASCSSLREMGI